MKNIQLASRQTDAKALIDQERYEAAYYIGGYAVECALKACIAKKTREFEFPNKDSSKLYTHRLEVLLEYAGTQIADALAEPAVAPKWSTVVFVARGQPISVAHGGRCQSFVCGIADAPNGVLECTRKHW